MKNRPKNIGTSFLTEEENKDLFSFIGRDRITLSTTLVRLLLSEGPKHLKWQIWCTGIACFIKDYEKRTFFISVYDFVERKMLWTQNLVDVFDCKSPQTLFVQFKGEEYSVGLQFVSETEAQHFEDLIRKVLERQNEKNDNSSKQSKKSFGQKLRNLFNRREKADKMITHSTHQTPTKTNCENGVVYTEVLCRPKEKPLTFEKAIVDNLFKSIDRIHPPIPRRFTRL